MVLESRDPDEPDEQDVVQDRREPTTDVPRQLGDLDHGTAGRPVHEPEAVAVRRVLGLRELDEHASVDARDLGQLLPVRRLERTALDRHVVHVHLPLGVGEVHRQVRHELRHRELAREVRDHDLCEGPVVGEPGERLTSHFDRGEALGLEDIISTDVVAEHHARFLHTRHDVVTEVCLRTKGECAELTEAMTAVAVPRALGNADILGHNLGGEPGTVVEDGQALSLGREGVLTCFVDLDPDDRHHATPVGAIKPVDDELNARLTEVAVHVRRQLARDNGRSYYELHVGLRGTHDFCPHLVVNAVRTALKLLVSSRKSSGNFSPRRVAAS